MTALAVFSIRAFLFILLLSCYCSASESAWNGFNSKSSPETDRFSSYYVSPGSKGVDSSSPFVHFHGHWEKEVDRKYAVHSKRVTSQRGAAVSFRFSGERVECYGSRGKLHSVFAVYIDGAHVATIDNWKDSKEQPGQLIYAHDGLKRGKHTIKLVNQPHPNRHHALLDIEAFVVTDHRTSAPDVVNSPALESREVAEHEWTLTQKGSTGVNAMQLTIVSGTHALIVDKVEHNPLTIDSHPAWSSLYNLETHSVQPVRLLSNSFCAGGSFLANGTLVNIGGNPVVGDHTGAADFGDVNGIQAVRLFHHCDNGDDHCNMYENPDRIRLASPRWYNTVLRISDGSVMVIGGSVKGGWINNNTVNNPTIEYYPPKSIHGSRGHPIHMPLLQKTVGANLFVHAILLPDGRVFIAANQDAMIYDWEKNTEQHLPQFPNGVRVTYPMAGTAVLLPLSPEDNYTPVVLICGGSTIDDKRPSYEISSQEPASSQCVRMALTAEGIEKGWEVEQMPQARLMPDAVILPTGDLLIVNGAGSGISGYGNVKDQVGTSNAANPVFAPVLYNHLAPAGSRFASQGLPMSDIPRLYHSVATLTPKGDVMVAGSNPNLDRSGIAYGTEYRVEWLSPPYFRKKRPAVLGFEKVETIAFGKEVKVRVRGCDGGAVGRAAFMDLGYVTHATHTNARHVWATTVRLGDGHFSVTAPPNGNVYPPGPAFLYFLCDGIPSEGKKLILGHGRSPPVDHEAIEEVLKL